MGRQAENSATLQNGRAVGYGLLEPKQRSGYWRVRFTAGGKRVELSTGAKKKGDARSRAPFIINAHFFPPAPSAAVTPWEEAMAELASVPHLRPATLKSYGKAVRAFRRVMPTAVGPADVTADVASDFMQKYTPKSANTARNVLRHLSSLWAKHFKALRLATGNPWEDISPPQVVKSTPRAPTDEDIQELVAYLETTYPGWELVKLFVQTKLYLGCRTADLCSLRSAQLSNGKFHFAADQTKARTARTVPCPSDLFKALDSLKGKTYLWERFAADSAEYRPNQNKSEPKPFSPSLLYWGVGNIFADFNRERVAAGKPKVRPHDLRRAAMTASAREHGVDKTARAFGVDPQTARRYYVDGKQAHDTDEVYASRAEGWRYGGGEGVADGDEVVKTPDKLGKN
jgi:integrase